METMFMQDFLRTNKEYYGIFESGLYSRKGDKDMAATQDLVLNFCPTMRGVSQRKLRLLIPVL